MLRTKLIDRKLPNYTRGEEIFNMVSHIVGGAIGVVVLVLCVIVAALNNNVYGIVTSVIYGSSMILLYTISSIYHGLRPGTGKKVFQVLDHCTIYILIAGTYTPILLSAIRVVNPVVAWTLFGIEWGLTAFAITLTAIDLKKFGIFSMTCYIAMGWAVIAVYKIAIEALTLEGFILLFIGGVLYTIGAVTYGIGTRKKYMHNVFHVFVLLGSFFQFLSIILYCL
ncbi:MAG TPA: hemolysin III family channel protein [Clostridiales bacterium]|nr:hemolysin III family channel protein [Clostridiales bacterium]